MEIHPLVSEAELVVIEAGKISDIHLFIFLFLLTHFWGHVTIVTVVTVVNFKLK